MSFVRGEGRQGNKQQLINGLLGFKMKIQKRETREHLYAQYLAVCRNFKTRSAFQQLCQRCYPPSLRLRLRSENPHFWLLCSVAPRCTSSPPSLPVEMF